MVARVPVLALARELVVDAQVELGDGPQRDLAPDLLAGVADPAGVAANAELRAFTRMEIDGDIDVIVPQRDGEIDAKLWKLHVEMVKQAQAARAELIATVVSTVSGFVKR